MPETITEEMGVHEKWYEERPKTPDELAAFVRKLLTDYDHDYGTICHACAAAALAAVRTVNADEKQGGITGFQAGCITLRFVRHWLHEEGPLRMIRFEDLLYPQHAHKFERVISPDVWTWLQEQAKKKLERDGGHPDVRAHWLTIAAGQVPFGFEVRDS